MSMISHCIRCMFQTMTDSGVMTEQNHDDDSSWWSMHIRNNDNAAPKWLFLRHEHNYLNNDPSSHFISSSHTELLQITAPAVTTEYGLQHHRTLLIHHLRGLHHNIDTTTTSTFMNDIRREVSTDTTNSSSSSATMSGITSDPDQSTYLSSDHDGEDGAFTVGMVISILACILIVILFLWLGYCACWFGFGGYVTRYWVVYIVLMLRLISSHILMITYIYHFALLLYNTELPAMMKMKMQKKKL